MSELKVYTVEEVEKHNTSSDLWLIIDGQVYDVSGYIDEHPGGEEVILDVAGQEATEAFDDIGHSEEAREILKGLLIGRVEGAVPKKSTSVDTKTESSGSSLPLVAVLVLIAALAAFYFIK